MVVKRKRAATREKIAFLNDQHFPHQDDQAIACTTNIMKALQPDTIILNGDLLDFYKLSSFNQDPMRIDNLQQELDAARAYLEQMREAHPEARIVIKEGNHEHRLKRYLSSQAPALASLRCLSVEAQLGLADLNIEYYDTKTSLSIGNLCITHGDRVAGQSGYTAHGMLRDRGVSGISGHVHRLGRVWKTDGRGIMSWTENGCLCSLSPCYAGDKALNWQQGMSIAYRYSFRDVERIDLSIVPIENGIAQFEGRIYTPLGVYTA